MTTAAVLALCRLLASPLAADGLSFSELDWQAVWVTDKDLNLLKSAPSISRLDLNCNSLPGQSGALFDFHLTVKKDRSYSFEVVYFSIIGSDVKHFEYANSPSPYPLQDNPGCYWNAQKYFDSGKDSFAERSEGNLGQNFCDHLPQMKGSETQLFQTAFSVIKQLGLGDPPNQLPALCSGG